MVTLIFFKFKKLLITFLGRTLTCPVVYTDHWACPDGRKIPMETVLTSNLHVNQSHLVKKVEQACKITFPPFCKSLKKSFLQVYKDGDCSGGIFGDMADIVFVAAWYVYST